MFDWVAKNVSVIVAVCAAIISLASLVVAVRALRAQREHNYLSVRPIAHFSRGDYEDSIFIKLKNYGAGPLLIDSFIVQFGQSHHERLIDALGEIASAITWDTFTDTIDGRALAPNKEFVLLKASFGSSQESAKKKIRSALSKMTLRLTYKDIYGRDQPEIEESLSWFSRN
jgi:hypothetical protein